LEGETGMIVGINGIKVIVLSDGTKNEVCLLIKKIKIKFSFLY
jgi:hypothetical protein